ncbi:sulfotransferase domain-containing protein [Alloalcanivorax profundimaris]|uniref:sulfotransferase domain-containing protein n=1 Tax=Alloalcanivorax profundimaris TaxID=2735259 RepID=UPI0018887750|nr:sulfotransferase [Alloalcanivorax profundimaris]MBF1801809.1 hypothetical protein [Alloalcanivorax profundimaris]
MRKPDFLIVGGAKSGTTSLSRYLNAHPKIRVVSEGLEFFGEYENAGLQIESQDRYLSLFNNIPSNIIAGEKSVSYLYSREAPGQIYKMNPDMKIIIILRNPIFRAYSDYWHRVREGTEELSFDEALVKERERIQCGARFELHYANYGLYYEKVKNYIDIFGQKNVLVLTYDDLKSDPERVCGECFDFFGLEKPSSGADFIVHNKGGMNNNEFYRKLLKLAGNKMVKRLVRIFVPFGIKRKITIGIMNKYQENEYPPISDQQFNNLKVFYRNDLERLSELLGRDLTSWLDRSSE